MSPPSPTPANRSLLAACVLVVLSVLAIEATWNVVAVLVIFAMCGATAGLAWPRLPALLVPVAAAAATILLNIARNKGGLGLSGGDIVVIWSIYAVPGVVCGAVAILVGRHVRRISQRGT